MEYLLLNPVIRRWVAIILLSLACSVTCFIKGMSYQQGLDAKAQVVQIVKDVKKTANMQNAADKVGAKVEVEKEKVHTVYKTITKKEIEYVALDPHANDVLEPSFVRLYNAAALACDPSQSTCIAKADVAGDVTHAEVLDKSKEADELYQTCRTAVVNWQLFYDQIRAKYNADLPLKDQDEPSDSADDSKPIPESK